MAGSRDALDGVVLKDGRGGGAGELEETASIHFAILDPGGRAANAYYFGISRRRTMRVVPAERVAHGIRLFNERKFFECHEVLEAEWTPERGPRRIFLQSLIHVAVAFYHEERGNPAGALRQLRKGTRKLAHYLPEHEGIDTARLLREAMAALERLESGGDMAEPPRIHRLPD